MKNIVQIGFYHDLYLGIFSMIKAYSMGKKHPCFFFFCCWCDWGSGEESSLKMKVAHVFSGGSASRIFHETSLSLVKIPCPAPPIFWVRICQNSAETQCLTQHKKSYQRMGAHSPLQSLLQEICKNLDQVKVNIFLTFQDKCHKIAIPTLKVEN